MGAYKKSVFMRDSGVVSINIGDTHYLQIGREDARELAEMLLKVVDSPLTVDERQAQARIIPAKDGTGIWFYRADDTVEERLMSELDEKFKQALFDEIVRPVKEEEEEND